MGKIIVIVTTFVLLSSCQSVEPTSDTPGSEVLPTAVAQLRDEIQEMGPGEVYTAIVTRFGKETRNIGSGLSILQWDLKEGSLIFHPLRGPTFCPKTGGVIWLLRTKNLARPNVLQNYEMTTLPDTGNHGTLYWIGDVKITSDMMYRYISSGFNLNEHGEQSENYFIAHPEGRVVLEWPTGLSDETCLETIGDRTIAYLTFHSEKEDSTLRCSVSSSSDSRLIEISNPPFQMWTSWLHFWRVE